MALLYPIPLAKTPGPLGVFQPPAVSGCWEIKWLGAQYTSWVGFSALSVDARLWQAGAFRILSEVFFLLLIHFQE